MVQQFPPLTLPGSQTSVPAIHALVRPHIASFDNIWSALLQYACKDISPREIMDAKGNVWKIWIENAMCGRPENNGRGKEKRMWPTECRERGIGYKAQFSAQLHWTVNGVNATSTNRSLGTIPVMLKSSRCNLKGMSPRELVDHKEEDEELGGYFIVNGIERLIRMLVMQKRNHVLALERPSFSKRGLDYSAYATTIRCLRPDETSLTVYVHYLNDGDCKFRFHWRKTEYLLPVVLLLKALIPTTDREIYESIIQGDSHNTFVTERAEIMLRNFATLGLHTQSQCLEYLAQFRQALSVPESFSEEQVGHEVLKRTVLVHLNDNRDKFNLLIHMIQKVYSCAAKQSSPDNPDASQFHEVLLGGHLYNAILKERLDEFLSTVRTVALSEIRRSKTTLLTDPNVIKKIISKTSFDIGAKMDNFLATGNLVTSSGMDLSQTSGFTIVAEKLNYYRYIAHFRSIHRGAFFNEIKTTSVRKLLPEAWGYLCPVHTPDGTPCGLLNHLTHTCEITTEVPDTSSVPQTCIDLGMSPIMAGSMEGVPGKTHVKVFLDGRQIGSCSDTIAEHISRVLRWFKVTADRNIPLNLELGYVPPSEGGQYPGLYMFSGLARMMRPVKYLLNDAIDMVGSFEQVYLNIACMEDEVDMEVDTHKEVAPTSYLSLIANLTPFSDFNQSPRNMYQCQMGKQSMGTPVHAFPHRTDNKLYRLQNVQTPIVRPRLHDTYKMDRYPNGFNAIVAVISYTGYDMEDAMIINKGAYERGLGHGSVYKTAQYDLSDYTEQGEKPHHHFESDRSDTLDPDGLIPPGTRVTKGEPIASYLDRNTGRYRTIKFKDDEPAVVEQIRLIGNDTGTDMNTKISVKYRYERNPIIGDKFSSRHGQKGVCSFQYPTVDLPFTESGMQPDIIINPHAFPSRMTIGMFVESMAGKAGAMLGLAQDATPFSFTGEKTAVDHFGEQLIKSGYNYHGNEPMYSGITGEEFQADIYIGVVYYQRLRHMVSDKFQVRTTGPVHNLTHQPVKGRKRAGGIRFGEMERDSLLAHGASFMLQDRLMNCSDYSQTYCCRLCGSMLSPIRIATSSPPTPNLRSNEVSCLSCDTGKGIQAVAIPFVLRYLANELLAMGIQLQLGITSN